MAVKFRLPNEIAKRKNRVPISARLDNEIKVLLEDAAKSAKLSLGELIESVLEDYSEHLKSNYSKAKSK